MLIEKKTFCWHCGKANSLKREYSKGIFTYTCENCGQYKYITEGGHIGYSCINEKGQCIK